MTKASKQTKSQSNQPKGKKGSRLPAQPKKQKQAAEVVTLPAPKVLKGSVVAAQYKAKAGKSGVWKADQLDAAVRNAFLSEGSTEVEPQQAARLATDRILSENHLDAGRWPGKNAGMLSMNLRNVLRGLLRNDGVVFVYGKQINA